MDAGTSVVFEMEMKKARRSARQKKQSVTKDATIFARTMQHSPLSRDLLRDLDISTLPLAAPVRLCQLYNYTIKFGYYRHPALLRYHLFTSLACNPASGPKYFSLRSRRHSYSLILPTPAQVVNG